MAEELELPSELYGFGNVLLWVLATRATQTVDLCYSAGPARPSSDYGTVDGHPVPTASLVAWLLTAAELGLPVDGLTSGDSGMARRQHVLRTTISRVLSGRPELFESWWLDHLAVTCRLGPADVELLAASREEAGHAVDPEALRQAIARTLRSRVAATRPVSGTTAATRTLPRDVGSFVGRDPELRQLMAEVNAAPGGGVVGIHAIGGMAGVGKTAFAVHMAHRLATRFPDGQIFLPLHGHTPGQAPVAPEDALARLLQLCGISAAHIPQGLEARAALWRDRLAGRRLLLLLDDAAGHEQVRPLLPGTSGSLVIITSRRRLTALEDAHPISLDTLTPDDAAQLFMQLAGRAAVAPGDADVGQITQLCGCLPLAIGMQARRLDHHPAWTAADLATRLATAHDRLALMQAENLSVAAAFDLSYQDLTAGERRLFRRLGVHPGDDIDVYSAAALNGTDLSTTQHHLEALYDHYLLSEPALGRYRLHDLIREHARARAAGDPPADRNQALSRLLDYYQHTAARAEDLLGRRPRAGPSPASQPPAAAPALPDRQHALAWARAERTNLLACLDHATRRGQHARVTALTASIAALLRHDGPWADALDRHTAALHAAPLLGDRLGEANARHEIGVIHRLTGDYPQAIQAQATALSIYHDLGNRLGQANARHEQGALGYLTGDYDTAVAAQQAALGIYLDFGNELGQADSLLYLGAVRYQLGDVPAAAEVLEAALDIYRDHSDQHGQANARQQLGAARQQAGDYRGAADEFQAALRICRNLGYRAGEANALHYLAATWRLSGDHAGAAEVLEAALEIYRDIGDPGGEAEALNELGTLQRIRGSLGQAGASHQAALRLARTIDSTWDEAHALAGLGRCAQAAHRVTDARAYLRQAHAIFRTADADEAARITAELDALTKAVGAHAPEGTTIDVPRECQGPAGQ